MHRFAGPVRVLRCIAATLTVLFYFAMGPIGYAIFFLLSIVPLPNPEPRRRLLQAIMRRAFRLMHHWLRWVRVIDFHPGRVTGTLPDGPCVVVTNHPSLTDVTAIMGVVPRLCTAVKPAIYDRWMLRPLLESSGQFSAGRDPLFGAQQVREAAGSLLQRGYRVLLFPEGTRSPRGGLGRFGRTAFALACEADLPVVPVVIREAPTWLAKGDSVYLPPADLCTKRLHFLPPVHPRDYDGDSRRLCAAVRALYEDRLPLSGPTAMPSTFFEDRPVESVAQASASE